MRPLYILATLVPHWTWPMFGVYYALLRGMCQRRISDDLLGLDQSKDMRFVRKEIKFYWFSSMRICELNIDVVCLVHKRWVWWLVEVISEFYLEIVTCLVCWRLVQWLVNVMSRLLPTIVTYLLLLDTTGASLFSFGYLS